MLGFIAVPSSQYRLSHNWRHIGGPLMSNCGYFCELANSLECRAVSGSILIIAKQAIDGGDVNLRAIGDFTSCESRRSMPCSHQLSDDISMGRRLRIYEILQYNIAKPNLTMALPDYFVWTRYGTEGGEAAGSILARKEQERQRAGGLFLWGIGNSVACRSGSSCTVSGSATRQCCSPRCSRRSSRGRRVAGRGRS